MAVTFGGPFVTLARRLSEGKSWAKKSAGREAKTQSKSQAVFDWDDVAEARILSRARFLTREREISSQIPPSQGGWLVACDWKTHRPCRLKPTFGCLTQPWPGVVQALELATKPLLSYESALTLCSDDITKGAEEY